jgi:ribonucleoside-diphosphate reductase alpha chain
MKKEYLGITIDTTRNEELSPQASTLLKDYYCRDGESPQEAFARAAVAYSNGDSDFAQRIYDYASRRWFMFASPVLSNAPLPSEKVRGLPISCFLTYVGDTLESLIEHNAEVSWLSVKGGGVGGHWSDVRPVTEKSPGVIPFLKVVDSQMTAYKQGKTRKGSYAAYLDVSHPDIQEFMNFKVPTGGDPDRKCFNLFSAVNVSDDFMIAVENDMEWELIDPNTGEATTTVMARQLWQRILETRFRTGVPYINFIDEANRQLNPAQKAMGLKIHGSNLCNEIHLATNDERTAVCCLSSINLEKYDDFKDSQMVRDLVRLLDNVLDVFIDNAPDELSKARYSAMQERSIGLGAMGFHGLLQQRNLPWENPMAKSLNLSVFNYIYNEATAATRELAVERGEPDDLKGTGKRNAHLIAIAPNANSSIICGCTASIEPVKSNAFTHRTRAGAHLIKNRYLEKLLEDKGRNNEAVWKTIIAHQGSVQHLEFLDEWEKDVFKTAFEIDQRWVVDHAADRQKYVCQGQSVNLFFPSGSDKSYVNAVHLRAFKHKLKGLYYLRTNAGVTADQVGDKVKRVALKDADECLACHG